MQSPCQLRRTREVGLYGEIVPGGAVVTRSGVDRGRKTGLRPRQPHLRGTPRGRFAGARPRAGWSPASAPLWQGWVARGLGWHVGWHSKFMSVFNHLPYCVNQDKDFNQKNNIEEGYIRTHIPHIVDQRSVCVRELGGTVARVGVTHRKHNAFPHVTTLSQPGSGWPDPDPLGLKPRH